VTGQAGGENQRIYARIEYQKAHRLRFLGHLDVATVFDRAVRRAQLPVAYTEGFHPRAKITFASPLPVGVTGLGELCGIDLVERLSHQQLAKRLSRELPDGLALVSTQVLPRTRRSPFADLSRADYIVTLQPDEVASDELQQAVQRFLNAERVEVQRQTKRRTRTIDIRPGTHELSVTEGADLQMSLSLRQDDLVKPAEVLAVLAEMMQRTSVPVAQMTRSRVYQV